MDDAINDDMPEIVRRQLNKILNIEKNIGGQEIFQHGESIEEISQESNVVELQNLTKNNTIEIDADLDDRQVLISTPTCGIICKPKEIRVEKKFFVMILSNEDSKNFILIPGTRLNLAMKNIEHNIVKHDIFFSGIKFVYNDDVFIIFHEV